MSKIVVPQDVAEHCRKAAKVLSAHKAEIDHLWSIWADDDPDAENGFYWHVRIDHPDADKMRQNMAKIAEFLNWIAQFSPEQEGDA